MVSADDLPKHDALFWPVVDALRQLDGSADNDQLVEKVAELLHAWPHDPVHNELAGAIAYLGIASWGSDATA